MTEPTDAEALPGLELARPAAASKLVDAVDKTLATLAADGHVDVDRDAARVELARSLAAVIDAKRSSGRASTVGQDAKVLLELLDGLVPAEAASSADLMLVQAMDTWSAMVAAQTAQAAAG